jgi:hypothetical protein
MLFLWMNFHIFILSRKERRKDKNTAKVQNHPQKYQSEIFYFFVNIPGFYSFRDHGRIR